MPKKFPTENSKAAAARSRKSDKAQEDKQRKEKEIEDAKWKDDDKQLNKKLARKEEAEKKRLEALAKKKERADLVDEEEKTIASAVKKGAAPKVTQAQIRQEIEHRDAIARASAKGEKPHFEKPIEENVNVNLGDVVQARNLDEAISALSMKDSSDKHPEKRMKAAYEEFESERLPQLKTEFSNLRLSQLKQMLKKEWMKHPENPLNQRIKAYNEK
uniref:Coiled-coil domain-containing protein 124 n=1 Tax=Caligus clemensi TaxID=344056 RepID=C1C0V4_CALCM|nr:Coiled-coil domain-containing protein 124 [Caligus clemensi]